MNNKNTKNRARLSVLVCLLLITALFATACSGDGGATATTESFSQNITSEGVHIWYECQNDLPDSDGGDEYIIEGVDDPAAEVTFGRETKVIWIKVYQDGKLSTYSCLEDLNLGYFSKMTDEEILKDLEESKDRYLCGQKDQPYQIYLYSDAAGKEVVFEGVPSLIKTEKKKDPKNFMTLISTEEDGLETFPVYESYYGGFALFNYDETQFRQACMVTRCEEDAKFSLDAMDLEGAILDYKTPLELLTELNAEKEDEVEEEADADAATEESAGNAASETTPKEEHDPGNTTVEERINQEEADAGSLTDEPDEEPIFDEEE